MENIPVTRHPLEWSFTWLTRGFQRPPAVAIQAGPIPVPRRITLDDIGYALQAGYSDFRTYRTDVVFLCIIYPLVGLLLGQLTFGGGLLHLAFPLIAGFALLGPLFAAGLYEMSRQGGAGATVSWLTAFEAFRSPAIGSILALGVVLLGLFAVWIGVAELIYDATVGALVPQYETVPPGGLMYAVFHTPAGFALIVVGCGVGFLFAALVLSISLVSFPLMLDRDVGMEAATLTSLRIVRENPAMSAVWGAIVVAGLVLGSLPFLIGLAIVLPVLGHATWHLYRRILPV